MSTPKRTPIQEAVIELRKALGGISQQELAVRMGKALPTIARWETSRPPSDVALLNLQEVALRYGQVDLAFIFKKALSEEMGIIGIPMTIEERIYHDGLMDILRNRDVKGAELACRKVLDSIVSGHSNLIQKVKAGDRLFGAELDELENTFSELKVLQAKTKERR